MGSVTTSIIRERVVSAMNAEQVTQPALRYHGGKFRLANWIMSFFPEHRIYTEVFGGAAGVLLQKERCYAEVYNDLDGDVVNFFRVLQNEHLREELIRQVAFTPYARDEFIRAHEETDDPVERARRVAVRAQCGFGSAGATKGRTGFRIDTRREYGTAQHLWAYYPEAIERAGKRLSGVLIENASAIKVLRQHDGPETLHFVDPPYVHSTRVMRGTGVGRTYRHEMDDAAHVELLEVLLELEGFVVLSGYPNPLYNSMLAAWDRYETSARISAARGTVSRTEVVWINPRCGQALAFPVNGLLAPWHG